MGTAALLARSSRAPLRLRVHKLSAYETISDGLSPSQALQRAHQLQCMHTHPGTSTPRNLTDADAVLVASSLRSFGGLTQLTTLELDHNLIADRGPVGRVKQCAQITPRRPPSSPQLARATYLVACNCDSAVVSSQGQPRLAGGSSAGGRTDARHATAARALASLAMVPPPEAPPPKSSTPHPAPQWTP